MALQVDRREKGVCIVTTLEPCCLRSGSARDTGSFFHAPGRHLLGCLYSKRVRLCAFCCSFQGQRSGLPSAFRTLRMCGCTHTNPYKHPPQIFDRGIGDQLVPISTEQENALTMGSIKPRHKKVFSQPQEPCSLELCSQAR